MSVYYDGSTVRYLSVTQSASSTPLPWELRLHSSGWTLHGALYPNSTGPNNAVSDMFSVGVLAGNDHGYRATITSARKLRFFFANDTGGVRDITLTGPSFNLDEWNFWAVTYQHGRIALFLNGSWASTNVPNNSCTPDGDVGRIGYSVTGGSTSINGRMSHICKYNRQWTDNEAIMKSCMGIDPELDARGLAWHSPLWDGNFIDDTKGNVTITETGTQVYGLHSNHMYGAEVRVHNAFAEDLVAVRSYAVASMM